MSCHVQTGNKLDVIYTYEGERGERQVILGIEPWGGKLIPLPNPQALAVVLLDLIEECKRHNSKEHRARS